MDTNTLLAIYAGINLYIKIIIHFFQKWINSHIEVTFNFVELPGTNFQGKYSLDDSFQLSALFNE